MCLTVHKSYHYHRMRATARHEVEKYLPAFTVHNQNGKPVSPRFAIDGRLHFTIVSGSLFEKFPLTDELKVVQAQFKAGSIAAANVSRQIAQGFQKHGHKMVESTDLRDKIEKNLRDDILGVTKPYLVLTHMLNLLDAHRLRAHSGFSKDDWLSKQVDYSAKREDAGVEKGAVRS